MSKDRENVNVNTSLKDGENVNNRYKKRLLLS